MKTDEGIRLLPFGPRTGEDDVEIAVACAGICRTDLHVAAGTIPAPAGRVLGHELSGRVARVGDRVEGLRAGDRVTVFPIVGCGVCAACEEQRPWRCETSTMLGVSRQGAFSDRLVVPQRAVFRLPESVSFEEGAYAEPVAASLAVLDAEIPRGARGVVLGRGRIAELTRRILTTRGIDAPLRDPAGGGLDPRSLDFVVETVASEAALDLALHALRPGGTLVLKSRPAQKVPIDASRAVSREITIRAVAYGRFEDALAMIESGALDIGDFLGPGFALEEHEAAFDLARRNESRKVFLRPGGRG
jgi:L-iditol 2-dehydrogenase